MRFWRNTAVANLPAGKEYQTTTGMLGYEWDEDIDNGSRPPGLTRLSATIINTDNHLLDNGSTYSPATVWHHLTLYRHKNGALVFGAGTAQWSWGLDNHHDTHRNNAGTPDPVVQQAMVNLFADMGVQAANLQPGLVSASASTDSTAPTSLITFPPNGAVLQPAEPIDIVGSATDTDGQVAAVEVSVDGGLTWHPAAGREEWSYTWWPNRGGLTTIMSRSTDDGGNLEVPSVGVDVIVGANPAYTPLQLTALRAWYRSDRGVTETNCARFASLGSNFLSTENAEWLDGLHRLTIAVDIRPNDVTARQAWVSRWERNGAQFILRCQGGENPGAIFFIVADQLSDPGGNFVKTNNDFLLPGVPVRIVVVFDSGAVTIYANGSAVATTTEGKIPKTLSAGSGADLCIGTDLLPSFMDGLMSRLCIWVETALTPDQVTADFNAWIGVDPASGEPVKPTHAWRLDEAGGTRHDCVGDIDLSDNNGTGSEAHVTRVEDLSGNGFHARMRPVNGPVLVDKGLGGKPTIRHIAANWQFLACGLLTGPTKPEAWSLYALAMCSGTAPAPNQSSLGFFNTFGVAGADKETWIVCVLSDTASLHNFPDSRPDGSIGMGCGDTAPPNDKANIYNQANSPASTYLANVWFQLTGIFPGGSNVVEVWVDGVQRDMKGISGAAPCACAGVAQPAVIGAATLEGTGMNGFQSRADNDFFDGQWADIAVCAADTTSQREAEEAFQKNWFREP